MNEARVMGVRGLMVAGSAAVARPCRGNAHTGLAATWAVQEQCMHHAWIHACAAHAGLLVYECGHGVHACGENK